MLIRSSAGAVVQVTAIAAAILVLGAPTASSSREIGYRTLAGRSLASVDVGHALAVEPSGRLVVAGVSRRHSRYKFAVARYSRDGKLDPSFARDGTVLTGLAPDSEAYAVSVRRDGKPLVAGLSRDDSRPDFALVRYTTDGRLDPSFADGGKALIKFGAVSALAVQTDGGIIAAGSRSHSVLLRFTANGRLDARFGRKGEASALLGYARAVVIQADGKIVVAGSSVVRGRGYFALARFTAGGKLDSSFGSGGKTLTGLGYWADAYGVALQADGKIVVAGTAQIALAGSQFAVARYTAGGRLDSTFGDGGKVLTGWDEAGEPDTSRNADGRALAIQPNGKLVVAGSLSGPGKEDTSKFALARYTDDGSLDPSFGPNRDGRLLTTFPDRSKADAIAVQAAGKLIAAGTSDSDFAVARYTDDGKLDPTFGRRGEVTTPFGRDWMN